MVESERVRFSRFFYSTSFCSVLPHSLHDESNTTVCLIMRDLDNSEKARHDPDVDKQAREWAERLERQFGITKKYVQKVSVLTSHEIGKYLQLRYSDSKDRLGGKVS